MKRATHHDSWLNDKDSSSQPFQKEFEADDLEKQKETGTTKTFFDGIVGSYKTPTRLVDNYIQYLSLIHI